MPFGSDLPGFPVSTKLAAQRREPPIVQDEKVDFRPFFQHLDETAVAFGHGQILQQTGGSKVNHTIAFEAGPMAQCTCQETFALMESFP